MVFWQHQPRPSVHVRYLSATHSPPPSCCSNVTSTFCCVPAASRGRPAAVLLPDIITGNNSSGNIFRHLQFHCVEIGFQFRIMGKRTLPCQEWLGRISPIPSADTRNAYCGRGKG